MPLLGAASIKGSTLRFSLASDGRATLNWLPVDTDSGNISLGRGGTDGSADEMIIDIITSAWAVRHTGCTWRERVGRWFAQCAL